MPTVAIAGNPNCGKSCIFNSLTGGTQEVGNFPGVTVEHAEGEAEFGDGAWKVVDLPGTYSLAAYSKDEVVARDYILKERPDVIIDVVDASNLERNLYLTVQLFELGVPVVLALNMVDVAERHGVEVDSEELSELFGVKAVKTIGRRGIGIKELKEACEETRLKGMLPKPLGYSHELSEPLLKLAAAVKGCPELLSGGRPPRWTALKLLEGDAEICRELESLGGEAGQRLKSCAEESRRQLSAHSGGEDAGTAVSEARYGIVSGAVRECMRLSPVKRRRISERIDNVVCNRLLGPLILVGVVYALFTAVFKVSEEWTWLPLFNGHWESPGGLVSLLFEKLSGLAETGISNDMLRSLLKDGVIGGVGGVLGFAPLIFFMFLFVAALEDSGYIARVAFILDRAFRACGLQGNSVLAMIVSGGLGGGGCAVPGVLATRTLREEKDRLVTILVAPMMNCGAKMPVYAMLIAAFFEHSRGPMMFLLWLLSWVFAMASALFLRRFVITGEQSPFVMELPVYHVPTLKGVLMHTWTRTWMYVKKAGTLILAVNIVIWALMYFPVHKALELEMRRASALAEMRTENLSKESMESLERRLAQINGAEAKERLVHSYAGRLGAMLEPVSRLAGFDWRLNIALVGGFAAKEIVVGTLGTVYSFDGARDEVTMEKGLAGMLKDDMTWSPLKAFAAMLFVMLYAPCVATLAVIRKETGSWKWTIFSTAYSTLLAYIVAALAYQIGSIFVGG